MKPTAMALCGFRFSGQSSTIFCGASALGGGGDAEDAGLDAARAETAPVRLGKAQDERVFGGIVRLEGLAKAAEDFFVFVLVFLGEDDESGGGESVLADCSGGCVVCRLRFWVRLWRRCGDWPRVVVLMP